MKAEVAFPPPVRHRAPPRPLGTGRLMVRTVGELCITAGVLLLLFVAWQLYWTDVGANRDQARITTDLSRRWDAAAPAPAPPDATAADPVPAEPAVSIDPATLAPQPEPGIAGDAFAIVHVPRFGSSYARPVVQGTDLDFLKRGIGHYRGTAMPGEVGNFALAGHRTSHGRPLHQIADLRVGDAVVVETADFWFTYRVSQSRVVRPDQVEVIAPVPGRPGQEATERRITLTSCHPMYSARQRYIVHGLLQEVRPRSTGTPPAMLASG